MKCLVLGVLIVTLAGCSSRKAQPEPSAAWAANQRDVSATTQRIVPLSSSESGRLATLKIADDAARAVHEKASKERADYQKALLGKYAGERESLEISQDLKYVIAVPTREYSPYVDALGNYYHPSPTCPTTKKKRKAK